MPTKEHDERILSKVDNRNIITEIHRLEGRLDFLLFCDDIPEDIRKREKEQAYKTLETLREKQAY